MSEVSVLCYDRLIFDRDYEIFRQLTDCSDGNKPTIKATPIPPQMWVETYEEKGVERRRKDKLGSELTFVYAQELKKLEVSDRTSARNRAIKAFIDALPDDTPIILLW